MMKVSDKELEELWDEFGDIPIDNEDKILKSFLHFEKGTDRFDVWEWFDKRYSRGVNGLVYR